MASRANAFRENQARLRTGSPYLTPCETDKPRVRHRATCFQWPAVKPLRSSSPLLHITLRGWKVAVCRDLG